jgi:parallel beta-helix repeat protein
MKSCAWWIFAGGMLVSTILVAQTTIPGGYVSGTWTAAGSPYNVQGSITIHADSTLNIEPGVLVNLLGAYSFTVNGYLEAVGTQADSIRFAGTATWGGVNFVNAPDSSHLVYCSINNAFTPVTCNNSDPVISHNLMTSGGIYGAIYVLNLSSPRISDCSITNAGRGIYWTSSANATIDSCVISNVYSQGFWWTSSASGTISGSIISGCGRSGVYKTSGNLTFIDCIISNNKNNMDDYGGGVRSQFGNVTFINCTISNDSMFSGEGGGVGCRQGTATFTNCTINGNCSVDLSSSPYLGGGGISLYNANAILSHCTIFDNFGSPHGGAIAIYNTGNLSINHCTIDGNESDCGMYPGSTIAIIGSSPAATIMNSIISNNYGWPSNACAIYNQGTLTAEYSDFYHNYPGGDISGNRPTGFGVLDTTNYNSDSCDIYYNIFLDPMFVDTTNGDLHLQAASICIDAGDPTSPLDPDGTVADMGCYYFDQSAHPVPNSVTDLTISCDSLNVHLIWSPVTTDTSGNSITVSRYIIYASDNPFLVPVLLDSIGCTIPPDTSFMDSSALTNDKRFYNVKAKMGD